MSGRLLLLALALIVAGCRKPPQAEAHHPQEATSAQPELLSVPPDQVARLKTVEVATANWSITVPTTGTVDWDADHTTQAITQVNGPITRIMADLGTPVQKDQPLLYVSSPDVANGISTYRKARNREMYNKRIVDRMKELLDRGAIAAKDFQSSEADYNDAMTDVQTSLQALRIFGITSQDMEAAEKQGAPVSTELAVRSPISGVVIQKLVSPGMVIQAGQTVCFAISDVSTVWVQGHIFDRDLPAVRNGDAVDETNPSFPHAFKGTISYIGSSVDPNTRTTPVRIVTQNPGGLLKKDMFVDAVVHTGMRRNMMVVPISAVLRDDKNEPMVYVETTPGKFAQRSVTMSGQQDGMAAIASGVRTGEKVVTDGGLFLQFANTIR